MPAAFPNVQGRLIASVRIVREPDDATGKKPVPIFLIDTEPATREVVLKTIQRFTLAGDFHVIDRTGQTALLSLQGKRAEDLIGLVIGGQRMESRLRRAKQRGQRACSSAPHHWRGRLDVVVTPLRQSLWKAFWTPAQRTSSNGHWTDQDRRGRATYGSTWTKQMCDRDWLTKPEATKGCIGGDHRADQVSWSPLKNL